MKKGTTPVVPRRRRAFHNTNSNRPNHARGGTPAGSPAIRAGHPCCLRLSSSDELSNWVSCRCTEPKKAGT
eukprot:scaffold303714_cov33-Tisochrysis_lutea.AAC.1